MDRRCWGIVNSIAKASSCLSRKVGCLIVHDGTIIGGGFNKPPLGLARCGIVCRKRSTGIPEVCNAIHAEVNAILTMDSWPGSTLYTSDIIPCRQCLLHILEAGITEIVCRELTYYDEFSKGIIEESGLIVRTYLGGDYD